MMTKFFSSRSLQSELMDDPELDTQQHRQALAGLRRINWWSQTDAVLFRAILEVCGGARKQRDRKEQAEPLTILDVASGGGDLIVRLARRFESAGIPVEIQGCDISPTAIAFATEQARNAGVSNVRFAQCNALQEPFPAAHYDIVMCTLFLHHLTQEEGLVLLQRMKAATRRLMLVDDLRRTAAGYWLAWLGCRILSRSPVVHYDGPVSVAGALTSAEALTMAGAAGLPNALIRHHWPQRYLMTWSPEFNPTGDP